ncbi:hypothetical protein MUN84_21545 [Hymenobacter sp. 5516J-16]|uniref:hypothetical protein n=1 Tax=Hymenobacter sp. 5516J-16 TaxID=2932253 RepID=UPI001FD14C4A|nr:hypothetical protein [Hymenobacter sp. 5516J-16]UOQ77021.1 hypothetical protein MUN84_21545 [Hymenobacter sp. 5516J-16]
MLLKLLVAFLLNALLLLAFLRWLPRVRQLPGLGRWVLPTLALKLVATGISVMLLSEDARYFLVWSGRMTEQLWQSPGQWLRMLTTDEFHLGRWHLVFHGFSNTFFLTKVLSVANLASLNNPLLTACYLSVGSFVGSWELVRQLHRCFPAANAGAAIVGFLLWPTVVYWTAGLTKESLLVSSGALVVALVVRLLYGELPMRWPLLGGLLVVVGLHFKMRYFFAVVLFGVLAGLGLVRLVQQLGIGRSRLVQISLIVGLLGAGAWAASEVSPVFRANKFTSQLQRNYTQLLASSRHRPHLTYPDLRPTTASVVRHAPQALVNTLVRPWPWEGSTVLYSIAGTENLGLLLVLLLALGAVGRRQPGYLPFALVAALLLYCCLVAVLLGLTTPNLGTLNRYRVTFLPFLLLLALQNAWATRLLRYLRL